MLMQNPFSEAPAPRGEKQASGDTNIPGSTSNTSVQQGDRSINDPNNTDDPAKPKTSDDPLLKFDKLWEDDPVDPKAPAKKTGPTRYTPEIDPQQLATTIGKMDFTKNAPPELLAAIEKGGTEGVAAHQKLINSAMQQTVATMFNASQRMVEQALARAEQSFLDKIPENIRTQTTSGRLRSSNKLMNDPAYGPLVESTRARYQEKYPKATAEAIEGAVNAYFDDMQKKFTKKDDLSQDDIVSGNAKKLRAGDGSADWESWFDGETIAR